jgi:hypothetical protein
MEKVTLSFGRNHKTVLDDEGAWFYARGQRSGWKVIYNLDARELKQLVVAWLAAQSVAPDEEVAVGKD